MHFHFHWQIYLFIYLLDYLFLNFWHFLYTNSIGFPKVKFCVILNVYFVHLQFMSVCVCLWLTCMFVCTPHCTLFVHAVFLFKTCICFYASWSVYVFMCVFFYLQYCVNVSVKIIKQLEHYNNFKQLSNFLVKGESVPPDAFSRES